ncbi:MAG: hypothetical protein IKJ84_04190 [Oscillospiraceae bacterium]|nr:hypothetical protein [Oscillospiraceae bacterium]
MAIPKIMFAGGGERGQYLTHKGNDTTIRFVLKYPGRIDPDILRQAVKAIVESVDILHSTFFVDPNAAYWRVNGEMDDNNYFRCIRTDGDPMVTARSLSVYPVYHEDKCQLRCELVHNDRESAIVLCISHLCVDGGDGKYLLNKLVEAYNLILETGSAENLTVKNGSRAPEKVYQTVERKDAKGMFKAPMTAGATSAYPFPTQEAGMCRVTTASIPARIMDAARKKAKAAGASANDLLLAAAYQVYADFPEVDRNSGISISSMMDLRRHCRDGESEGLCNMSGALPTAMPEGVPERFEETLAAISEQTAAAKEDPVAGLAFLPILHTIARGVPVWMQMMAAEKLYGAMPVGLTNLGNIRCDTLALGGLVPVEGVFGGPLKKKGGMQISIMSFDGNCVMACYGQYTEQDAAHIRNTLDAMAGYIAGYADT